MSGGHFNYIQERIDDASTMVDELISDNDNDMQFPADIIEKFMETATTLRLAAAMLQRVDWLVCGDDGEESFRKRWKQDIGKITIYVGGKNKEETAHRFIELFNL